MTFPDLVCRACGAVLGVGSLAWRCGCGGILDVAQADPVLSLGLAAQSRNSLWRYESALPVEYDAAVCWAAVRYRAATVGARRAADVVVPLCGAGLKHPD